jgi:hypothetical protein
MFLPAWFNAQKTTIISGKKICSYYGEALNDSVSFFPKGKSEAESMIDEIIDVVGLKPHFETRSANLPNAAAVIHGNKRYILYNPQFISSLNKSAGTKWASVSILAHEIGHHLNGHALEEGGSRPEIELEADEFSGFVMKRLAATLAEAQLAMTIAGYGKQSC